MNFCIARQFAKWNSSPNFPTIRYELPEIWAEPKDGEKPASLARAQKRVLDLNMWLQHFALFVGMLVPQSKELMAYVINITAFYKLNRNKTMHTTWFKDIIVDDGDWFTKVTAFGMKFKPR